MSADYWLEVDAGGPEPVRIGESWNVTYNLGAMLRAAGFPEWRALIGAPCSEAAGPLAAVAERMRADRDRLTAEYTPDNGWGSFEWALDFVSGLAADCAAYPKATIGGWL
jgi:hypothetical protein